MSAARRVQLSAGFVLHHRPYRDTSRIIEVFTREHGRLTLFARGVRGPRSKLAPLLQPFRPLLLSFLLGRGDAAQLTGAELAVPGAASPPPAALMSGYYLNELLLRLTGRLDAHPALYDCYARTVQALDGAAGDAAALRQFEFELLQALGYGLDLDGLEPERGYRFDVGLGFAPSATGDALPGEALLGMGRGEWQRLEVQRVAAPVLRAALAQCLDGLEIRTRAVARSLRRQVRR